METTKQKKYELTKNKRYYFDDWEYDDKKSCADCAKEYQEEASYTDGYDPELEAYELTQIRALRDIPEAGVKKGDLGGWVMTAGFDPNPDALTKKWWTTTPDLSQEGNCWLDPGAQVYSDCKVEGDAWLKKGCQVQDGSVIREDTIIKDSLVVASEINGGKIKDARIEKSLIDGDTKIENYEIYNSQIGTDTKLIATEKEFPYAIDILDESEERHRVKYQIKNSHIDKGVYLKNDSIKDAAVWKTHDNKIALMKEMPVIQREKKKSKVNLRPAKKRSSSNDMER